MILICCCRHFHFVCSKYSEENTAVPATNIVKTINIDYHLGKLPKNKMPKHMENSICFVVFISVSFPYMQIIEEVTLAQCAFFDFRFAPFWGKNFAAGCRKLFSIEYAIFLCAL